MSNIASLFLNNGFRLETESILQRARELPDPDRRVNHVAGTLAEELSKEENSLTELVGVARKTRAVRLAFAEAYFQPPPPLSSVIGSYTGTPESIVLEPGKSGLLTGSFSRHGSGYVLQGRLVGSAIRFTYTSPDRPGTGILPYLGRRSGHGLLIFENGTLSGYSAEGDESVDCPAPLSYVPWKAMKAGEIV
jgi:hypothetical protein